MRNQHNLMAKEGRPFVLIFFLISICFFALGFLGLNFHLGGYIFGFLALFTIYFFRNPIRKIDEKENSVVAPADGTIIKVEKNFENDFLKKDAILISTFMSLFNVHINRVPISGTVINKKHHPGKFMSADLDKASKENERCSLLIQSKLGVQILVVQIAGLIARRIVCYPNVGEPIVKGKRFGLIRFGSRLDVYLPIGSEVAVKVGQKIKAGDVLGYLK